MFDLTEVVGWERCQGLILKRMGDRRELEGQGVGGIGCCQESKEGLEEGEPDDQGELESLGDGEPVAPGVFPGGEVGWEAAQASDEGWGLDAGECGERGGRQGPADPEVGCGQGVSSGEDFDDCMGDGDPEDGGDEEVEREGGA